MWAELTNSFLAKIRDSNKMRLIIFFALIGSSLEYGVDFQVNDKCNTRKSQSIRLECITEIVLGGEVSN